MTSLALENKLLHSGSKKFSISGVNSNQWSVLFKLFFKSNSQFKRNIFLFSDESEAEKFYNFISSSVPTEFYPDIGSNIYSSMVPSEFNLTKRLSILSKLVNDKPEEVSIITTYSAINLYTPDQSYFTNNCFTLAVDDIITYDELSTMLVTAGYQRTPSIVEPGAFSIKGEIFDIFPFTGDPVRLFFFDELIESIFPVKPDSLITIKENPLSSVKIQKTQYSLLNKEFVHNFRSNLPRPSLIDREKFSYRELILKKLSSYNFFEDYPLFLSYFFKQPLTLLDYVPDFNIQIFDEFSSLDAFSHFKSDLNDNFSSFKQHNNEIIKPSPSEIYNINQTLPDNLISINNVNITTSFNDNLDEISIKTTSLRTLLKSPQQTNKEELFKLLCQMIEIKIKENIKIYIFYTHKNSKEEILYLLETFFENTTLISHIIFQHDYLHEGFFYNHEKILFVSENDFFEKKVKKAKAKRATTTEDLFADQLATLQINDYVIHKDFGVGQYKGMESLELSGSTSDYIVISYQDNDKVYVPIYKLHLLQKHSSKDAKVSIANLKSKKFEQAKQKAKNAVKVLAFDLLELQAKRKLKKGFAFSEPDHIFNEFSLSFRFDETPDQRAAIENVIGDMVSERPMDRLVCGDVGFGKTEVAMRAAFKAVLDNKQVGILVPTTVLALQHYNSFIERFKKFPIHIEFISRFKTAKQVKEILQKLTEGKVDILIGTHKLLSEKVKFKDLGLLVIDEEQRFGVAHKEKLKLLRETVDTLTLTATPIPRTLQLSFLGIKDLSLIKTPPPSRQTIKSYLIKEDNHTLKLAIQKELSRGGQVFIVHNKVLDIEIYTSKIRELAPQARIIFAHGQL
ncbi:MAG: DEAD/DEAH box helicase, partial [Halobacteriovoraceae bacterium]|nr:DEAD/DEAH box helicase [Halobacteriovoraceae bacterium]